MDIQFNLYAFSGSPNFLIIRHCSIVIHAALQKLNYTVMYITLYYCVSNMVKHVLLHLYKLY